MNVGVARARAAQAVAMWYLGVFWSACASVAVFGEVPDAWSAIGQAVIIGSTLLFALRCAGHVAARPATAETLLSN